jgi:hypothetical protein
MLRVNEVLRMLGVCNARTQKLVNKSASFRLVGHRKTLEFSELNAVNHRCEVRRG